MNCYELSVHCLVNLSQKTRLIKVLCFLCCFLFHRITNGRLQGYKGATVGLDRNIKTQAINSIKQPHTYIHRMCHLFLTCVARLPELHGFTFLYVQVTDSAVCSGSPNRKQQHGISRSCELKPEQRSMPHTFWNMGTFGLGSVWRRGSISNQHPVDMTAK